MAVEPPKKRAKLSSSPPPLPLPKATSSNSKKAKPAPAAKVTPKAKKSAPRSKFEEEPETEEAVKQRKRNIGKRFSPGDGQFDYTLSEFSMELSTYSHSS